MREWLALGLVVVLALAGCTTAEQRNEELVEAYLRAIVDGRLADAAAMHTSFGAGDHVVPREAYLSAQGRVDGYTIAEVTDRAAQVTLHAGPENRSGTLHITQDKIWDTWVWFEMSFAVPAMLPGAALNGVPVHRRGDVQSLFAPAGAFELTADAGPLLEVYPGRWDFRVNDPTRSRATRVLEMWLSDAGQEEADRQLSLLLDQCQVPGPQADPWCPWHTLPESPGIEPWTIDMARIGWQRCSWRACPGLVEQILVSTRAEDGTGIVSGAVHYPGTVAAAINPDLSITVELRGAQ